MSRADVLGVLKQLGANNKPGMQEQGYLRGYAQAKGVYDEKTDRIRLPQELSPASAGSSGADV